MSKDFTKSVSDGLKYPWNSAGRLWNILWFLIPIIGWFALLGYIKNISVQLTKGHNKELPKFGNFMTNLKNGFFVFLFLIPTFILLGIINTIPFIGRTLGTIISVFILPWLILNYFVKEDFSALWEIETAAKSVFNNGIEYILVIVKTMIFSLVYGLLSILLVGIPCYAFGYPYYLAEFYRKHN